MKASIPCPGCRWPGALRMSADEQLAYIKAAHIAFTQAEALIANAGKWSTTWAGYNGPTNVTRHGVPVTTTQCVGDVVQLIQSAANASQTFQYLVKLPDGAFAPPIYPGLEHDVGVFLLVRGEDARFLF